MVAGEDAGSLEKLLNEGWDYHDKESERLARELEAGAETGVASSILAPFLHLSIHTIGEHLGDWERALKLGRRVLDSRTPTFETAKAWGRLYVAAVLTGNAVEAADLELSYLKAAGDDFGAALLDMRFMLAGALIGAKRAAEGARLYRSAIDLIGPIQPSPLLDRTIAAASNNLGWDLYEMPARTVDECALMQLCAEMSHIYWLKCGDWINEERALYRKALVANVTCSPETGLAHADTALAVINEHGERPLDAALLHLARASSLTALGDMDGRLRAIADADAAASKLTATNLRVQFAAERARIAGT
jgi:hypothetical protein